MHARVSNMRERRRVPPPSVGYRGDHLERSTRAFLAVYLTGGAHGRDRQMVIEIDYTVSAL